MTMMTPPPKTHIIALQYSKQTCHPRFCCAYSPSPSFPCRPSLLTCLSSLCSLLPNRRCPKKQNADPHRPHCHQAALGLAVAPGLDTMQQHFSDQQQQQQCLQRRQAVGVLQTRLPAPSEWVLRRGPRRPLDHARHHHPLRAQGRQGSNDG
jgi:hypothetical protein